MKKTIIIAEAGINHNGSIVLAKQLIDIAAASGADYVKFQTFKTELNISKSAKKADYQIKNTNNETESQFDMVKKLELSFEEFRNARNYCLYKNIGFLSTGFDKPSIDFLDELGIDFFKIPSGEITNKPFLEYIAQKGKSIILSTGMANLNEIREAMNVILEQGLLKEKITVLHCNTEYPTPMQDVNLKAMLSIKNELGVEVGYSDHTLGIEVPIAAVTLGASVIEKHFTLDRNLPGPDHKASLEPHELKAMVDAIHNVELAISGSGIKIPSPSEQKNISIARKSIVAARHIQKGELLTEENICAKRPGDGLSPMLWYKIVGLRAKRDYQPDELIER